MWVLFAIEGIEPTLAAQLPCSGNFSAGGFNNGQPQPFCSDRIIMH